MSHTVNFLEFTEPEPVREEMKHRRSYKKIVVVVLVLLALYAVVGLLFAGKVVAKAFDGKAEVELAVESLLELDFEEAKVHLGLAETDFATASAGMKFFAPLRMVPWVGDQLEATEGILNAGSATAGALTSLLDVAEDVVKLALGTGELVEGLDVSSGVPWSELDEATKKAIILRFAASASDLERSKLEIDLILRDLDELPQDSLAEPLRLVLDPFIKQLEQLDGTLDAIIPIAFVLPSFAGLEREQHLLMLFLNNAEMRPGGGFIGSYGVVSFKDAYMTNFDTHDVMDVDGPATAFHSEKPPQPIKDFLNLNTWYFRDSNWSPDFAASTEYSLRLFHDETAGAPAGTALTQPYVAFDAVMGITPTFVADLLEIVGPITIEDQTFTAENILWTLEYAVEYGFDEQGIPYHQRKEIIGLLADELKQKLFDLPSSEWGEVFEVVSRALTQKQLVIYSADPTIEEVIARKDWAGRVFPGAVDTLMVVDANLAALKTDPAVERTVYYNIERSGSGKYIGQVQIEYKHTGSFDWKTSRYRTYTRIFVPEGSTLISTDGSLANDKIQNPSLAPYDTDVYNELGLTVFGAFTSIEPGETRTLSFEYELPDTVQQAVEDGVYELSVIKQIGAAAHEIKLDLDFDKKVKRAYPSEESIDFGDDQYILNTQIDQNLSFVVEF
ncbi:MAG: DUF4012 domain-containing protein [Candidatus Uhrbacteria bacterium]|nr:DUF4012 domain-containing protein [Patescibacteria group bacterium]MBU1906979.1 DUF4012 domain-containing protein [Patescibacteria group bacterium]